MKKFLQCLLTAVIAVLFAITAYADDFLRWKNPKKITVYIPQHKRKVMMKHCLEEWTKKTGKKIIFYYVESPQKADIEVKFVEKITETKTVDRTIGLTQSKYSGKYFIKSIIQIAEKTPQNITLGNDSVYTVMLHETGHAIGLLEHSKDKLSIMRSEEHTSELQSQR